jgi:hypothetical protein
VILHEAKESRMDLQDLRKYHAVMILHEAKESRKDLQD